MTKTPNEIKRGLVEAIEEASWVVEGGDAHDLIDACEKAHASMADALACIRQLEERNAWHESNAKYLASFMQSLSEQVERLEAERDSLAKYLTESHFVPCDICKHDIDGAGAMGCKRVREIKGPCFEWRGLPEPPKEEM